jgi:endoglucanase
MNRATGFARIATLIAITASLPVFADVAPLSVSGNQVRAGGQPASFAGNSLFWSNTGWGGERYYNANVVRWLKTDWKSTLVRAAMGVEDSGGYLQDRNGNLARVRAVIDAAIANDMYVIIDWHSHHAESYRNDAIAFFQDMARTYGNRNHVIYEIYNEPLQISWSGTIKPYAQAVVNAIRAIDPDNLIVVGTPTWSQDVDVAAADPVSGTNIAYTLHFYAGTHGQFLRDKAQTALNRGVALFVTEWGSVSANGDGAVATAETSAWMNFLKARGISHANWATNDKAEGASALVPGASTSGGWSASQLTPSGTLAKQIISGWSSTTQPPPSGTVIATIQAESFSQQSGIQTENTTDTGGGRNVGWIDVGDWLSYQNSPVNIPVSGTYRIEYRVASLNGGGGLRFEEAGASPVHGQLAVPGTGGWQNWTTISHNVNLSAGTHRFGINAVSGGWNLNWFRIVRP